MAKPITDVISTLRGGVFNNAASAELKDLVERVQEAGKPGSITITLTLSPHGKGNREIHVTPKLSTKKPAAPDTQEAGIFYAVRGDLVRDDPDQRKLPLEEAREARERSRTGTDD